MSGDAAPAAAPAKTPKKKVVKPKKPAAHPKYSEMIKQAVSALKATLISPGCPQVHRQELQRGQRRESCQQPSENGSSRRCQEW